MRECGDCSLCCKLLGIIELEKPAGKWCKHAHLPGKGCKIYPDRPPTCQTFVCGWLVNENLPDYWRPTRSKMVISMNVDQDPHVLQIYVDQTDLLAYQKEPYIFDINKFAEDGFLRQYNTEIRFPDGSFKIIKDIHK